MKEKEIVQALRCCAKGLGHDDACENCKVGEIQDRREYIEFAAANVIERLTAENAKAEAERDALLGELRKSGCTYCKYKTVCEDNPWLFIQKVCDHCGKRESCVCQTCTGDGSENDKWQWRGLPEAPEEGGKA
jgi:hypothetical protein